MPDKIFISYRRHDSAGHAGRVFDRLRHDLGGHRLFMDVDNIPLGVDFVEHLSGEVSKCDILLAVIGPGWLDARDEHGQRRLEDAHDFVRIEIAAALKRNIPVVPILLEGTQMPSADKLPDDLKPLSRRNALAVRHASFHADMDKLVRGLGTAPVAPAAPATAASSNRYFVAEGRIKVDAKIVHGAPADAQGGGWFMPGKGKTEWFTDHEHGPEMVVVPAGTFEMGSRPGVGDADERPHRMVTIAKPIAAGRGPVTRGQFATFVNATGHDMSGGAYGWTGTEWKLDAKFSWSNPGFLQTDTHPVVCVNWQDAQAYISWLASETRQTYRFLSETEWEYVCRAGKTTAYAFGDAITPQQANFGSNEMGTTEVGKYSSNAWGLLDTHGNAWEWCEDAWHPDYQGAPTDGTVWPGGETSRRVVRGGSWSSDPQDLRSAFRSGDTSGDRDNFLGFRVGRTLTP